MSTNLLPVWLEFQPAGLTTSQSHLNENDAWNGCKAKRHQYTVRYWNCYNTSSPLNHYFFLVRKVTPYGKAIGQKWSLLLRGFIHWHPCPQRCNVTWPLCQKPPVRLRNQAGCLIFTVARNRSLIQEISAADTPLSNLKLDWEEVWEISITLHTSLWLHTDVFQKEGLEGRQ